MLKIFRKAIKGFTLLEIMIVIIILGILASLALPRYTRTIEYARGLEALIQLGILRNSLFRFYLPRRTFIGSTLDNLDVENPTNDPRAHFSYSLVAAPATFSITARRNTFDNGDNISSMSINQDGQKSGTGQYSGIR